MKWLDDWRWSGDRRPAAGSGDGSEFPHWVIAFLVVLFVLIVCGSFVFTGGSAGQ